MVLGPNVTILFTGRTKSGKFTIAFNIMIFFFNSKLLPSSVQTLWPPARTTSPETPTVRHVPTLSSHSITPPASCQSLPQVRTHTAQARWCPTPLRPPEYWLKTQAPAPVLRPVRRSWWTTSWSLWTQSRSTTASFWTFPDIALGGRRTAQAATGRVWRDIYTDAGPCANNGEPRHSSRPAVTPPAVLWRLWIIRDSFKLNYFLTYRKKSNLMLTGKNINLAFFKCIPQFGNISKGPLWKSHESLDLHTRLQMSAFALMRDDFPCFILWMKTWKNKHIAGDDGTSQGQVHMPRKLFSLQDLSYWIAFAVKFKLVTFKM